MTKIIFFESNKKDQKYIKDSLKGFDVKFYEESLTIKNVSKAKDADILVTFIYSKISKDVIDKIPKLKCICTMSTGFDHIDVKYANSKNIPVYNVPSYGDNTVAEHAFALILSLNRKIIESNQRTKKGNFSFDNLVGFDLKDKTIGLVGTGRISANAAKIANGFGMNILGYDIYQNQDLVKNYNLKYVDLDYLLKNSDVVSLHLPLNDKTKHIIDKNSIKQMKKSAILINTARGGLIETNALVGALSKNNIAGAGLDVLEDEKNKNSKENKKLLKFDNVIVTPHNAFNSTEALRRIVDTTIGNVKGFDENKISNVVILK